MAARTERAYRKTSGTEVTWRMVFRPVLGAPGASERALAWWRSVASNVTANAHCSVHVVRVPERRTEMEPDSA